MQNWKLVLTLVTCLFLSAAQAEETASEATVDAVVANAETATPITQPAAQAPVQQNNNIAVTQKRGSSDASSVLGARASEPSSTQVALIPMIGGGDYTGNWGAHVTNAYSLGLALEVATGSNLAFEIEGAYNRFNTRYLALGQVPQTYAHDFNQYTIGANAKLYIVRTALSPYVGGGIAGLYYENMDHGPTQNFPGQQFGQNRTYSQWVGAAQLMAGADVSVAEQVAVGLRGSFLLPVINRPRVVDNGVNAAPGYEDASLMNQSQFRILGTARVAF